MRQDTRNHKNRPIESKCGEIILKGFPHQIAEKYEKLAAEARNAKDHVLEQTYLQHAEHFRRGER